MAMRRPNSTGTVYKMKHKKLRKPFRAVIVAGWTDEGKSIRKTIGTFATQREAYQALDKYHTNPDVTAPKRVITVEDCFNYVYEEAERKGLSKGRIQVIHSCQKHMKSIMKLDITLLRVIHVQHLFDAFTFTKSYQQLMKSILVKVCNYAIKQEFIVKNYMSDIIINKNATPTKKANVFSEEDIMTIWKNTSTDISRILLIYIYTGMRLNELLTMEVDNIHLEERYMIGGSKTEAGRDRVIPIAECIAPFIKSFLKQAKKRKSLYLLDGITNGNNYRKQLSNLCESLGLKRRKPHDTRHTFITLCSDYNIPEILVKHIVGHSTAKNITQGVYTHKTTQQYVTAVNKLPHSHC